jgi:poly(3-hydroxyoctanoate) depolymerase
VSERLVRVDGLDLFVRERGSGDPLLLLNGLGGNLEMWGEAEERLSRSARTIAFDAPGTGRSGTPSLPRTIPSLARLARSALDELGYDRVDVLGYSLGGVIAQQLAREAPERIRRMALVSTACGWGGVPGSLQAIALIATPWRYYSRAFYEQTNRLFGEADAAAEERLRAHADARLRYPPSFLGYAYQLWAGALWSSLTWLPSVDVPTLVVTGDADELVPPANSVQLAGLLPQSRLRRLAGEGHLLLFDPGSPAHALVEDFFRSGTESAAWSDGEAVDEVTMQRALRESQGPQPFRALSEAFRKAFAA